MDSRVYERPRRSKAPLVLLALLALAGGGGYFYLKRFEARRQAYRFGPIVMPERTARVPSNWDVSKLAERLQKAGKVHDASAFEEAADKIGLKSVQKGVYRLPAKASPADLARVFKAGPGLAKVTFPEGFTGWQIAARLEKEGFVGAAKLVAALYPPGETPPYEGTLFPDTYVLPLNAPPKVLIQRMQGGFNKTLLTLPKPFPSVRVKVSSKTQAPLSTRQLVTLASLVEREAAGKDEMPQVAGVLLNRLNRPMRLQVDAAIQYAYLLASNGKERKARLLYADYKLDSPYNTYRNDGLPPGPICNPGAAALQAVAKPAKTDALYYVYSPRLKKHLFAATYEQHLKNKAICEKERSGEEGARKKSP